MAMEQTFIMIKPDGVQRGLIGEVIGRFEKKGFYLKAMKLINVEKSFAEKHYADLSSKPFFGGLVEYIVSGPVVAMVWEGKQVVSTGRKLVGATNPLAAEPGTIRGDFAVDIGRKGFNSLVYRLTFVIHLWVMNVSIQLHPPLVMLALDFTFLMLLCATSKSKCKFNC